MLEFVPSPLLLGRPAKWNWGPPTAIPPTGGGCSVLEAGGGKGLNVMPYANGVCKGLIGVEGKSVGLGFLDALPVSTSSSEKLRVMRWHSSLHGPSGTHSSEPGPRI